MRTLAIANQKGGSGKTTTAVNLAAALGEKNRRVLLVDVDPQASSSEWLGVDGAGGSLFHVFTNNTALMDVASPTLFKGVDVAPSSARLVDAEKTLAGKSGAESILRHHFTSVPAGRWDYVLVDCPPSLGILTANALVAASEVCIPVGAHVLALNGLVQILKTMELIKQNLRPDIVVSGILGCRVDARTRHAREVVGQLRDRFGSLVYRVVIRENVRLAECPSFGQPIIHYAPRSAGTEDYRALADEVIGQERSS